MATQFDQFRDLPTVIQNYLRSEKVGEVNKSIFDNHKITDQSRSVLDAIVSIFLGQTQVKTLPENLQEAIGKDAKSLAAEIGARILRPAASYLGPVDPHVQTWDAQALNKEYSPHVAPLNLPTYTRADLDKKYKAMKPEAVTNTQAVTRFNAMIDEMLTNGRSRVDEEKYTDLLTRDIAIGGVQLAPDDAGEIIEFIKNDYLASNSPEAAAAIATTATSASNTKPNAKAKPSSAPKSKKKKQSVEDINKEIKATAKTMRTKLGATAGAHEPSVVEAVDELIEKIAKGVPGSNPEGLRSVLESRVKNVRDTRATTEALIRSGLAADVAMQVITIVEQHMQSSLPSAKKAPAKKQKTSKPKKKKKTDDTFTKVVGRKQIGATHEDNIRTSKIKKAEPSVVSEPKPEKPEPTHVKVPSLAQKPKVKDVKKATALTGPVQEIANLRMIDFRRSSPDASVRMDKIISTADRIGEESYVEKIQAIFAWRRSEPYVMYENMLIEALKNRFR